ncbi:MAG: formimidoylglutamate deiminase [Alphaproteobacteria bacterium]|nr:formimidoylglutamate deiminase [Alphaproteobacteria bacterium]
MTGTAARLWCPLCLLPTGWAERVLLHLDDQGTIRRIESGVPAGGHARLPGVVIPGMPNLHSHAFQRAMAGLTERGGGSARADFWSWRETMYSFVSRLTPEQVEAIAAHLYVEMVKAGYTGVAEFHYLHNPPGGGRYRDVAELARRIAAGATAAGIRLTLLPVLYREGGFGGAPLGSAQQRFRLETDEWARTVAALARASPTQTTGAALHSLRAVLPADMADALAAYDAICPEGPVHIHIAEQEREVAECLAWSGRRPVEWLLDSAQVDRRWTLVHATHMTADESKRAAATGAIAGLCPTTEANLGDGVFAMPEWLAEKGAFGVGSDSNVSLDPREELRWLEYGQRLTLQRRLVANNAAPPGAASVVASPSSLGAALWLGAAAGGSRAMGQPCGALAEGRAADFLVLDPDHPTLAAHRPDTLLDAWVFTNAGSALREVWIAGRRVVADGRHPGENAIRARFHVVMADLMQSL